MWKKAVHVIKLSFLVLSAADCNQWVGVETSHSLSSHDGERYLHERNKDAAEVAWCVWLDGFLHRLLVGCDVKGLHVKVSKRRVIFMPFFGYQTHHPDKQRSWQVFPRCSWWPGSRSERVHLSQLPVKKWEAQKKNRGFFKMQQQKQTTQTWTTPHS